MTITTEPIRKATDDEKRKVRHFTFRTGRNEGVVTGIAITTDCKAIRMFSAGCLHGVYMARPNSVLVSVEPLA